MTGKIPQGRDDLSQAQPQEGPSGKDLGAYREGAERPSALSFVIVWVLILSVRSLLMPWLLCSPCLTQPENNARGSCGLVLERMAPAGQTRPEKECTLFPLRLALRPDNPVGTNQTFELKE